MPGLGRANIVGYGGGQFLSGVQIVGIEAMNDVTELDGALEGMKAARQHTHASYIACTPAQAAEFLWAQTAAPGVSRWDAEALRRRLQASGCGLLLVEGDAVAQALLPVKRKPDSAKLAELATAIQSTGQTSKVQKLTLGFVASLPRRRARRASSGRQRVGRGVGRRHGTSRVNFAVACRGMM